MKVKKQILRNGAAQISIIMPVPSALRDFRDLHELLNDDRKTIEELINEFQQKEETQKS